MDKEDLRQLVTDIGDSIYSDKESIINEAFSTIYAVIMNNTEELVTEVINKLINEHQI